MLAFLNGDFIPAAALRLHPADAGLVFGAAVSDVARTYRGRLLRHADHVARFARDCAAVGILLACDPPTLLATAERLVAANCVGDGEVMLVTFATPGPVAHYLGDDDPTTGPTVAMHTAPLRPERFAALLRDGADLVTSSTRHQDNLPRYVKQRSRLFWHAAAREAAAIRPGAQALLLDAAGCVTETATANFLIARGGDLFAPPVEDVLDGMTLRVVIELCAAEGIAVHREPLLLADCLTADEALLTGTAFGVAGVRRINDATIPHPGPVLRRLRVTWEQFVTRETTVLEPGNSRRV